MSANSKTPHDDPPAEITATPAGAARPDREDAAAEPAAASDHTDERLDRAGERAGARVGQVLRSGERAGQFLRSGAEQVKQFRVREREHEVTEPASEELLPAEPAAAVARAEVIMDRAGERVGQLLRFGGQQVHRSAALAREAIEDFVAEAESIRRGERPNPD